MDAERLALVRALQRQRRGALGSRQMLWQLRRRGHPVGRHQTRRLMREAGAACRQRRRFRATTDSNHGQPVAANLLDRGLDVSEPNTAWCADITAIWTLQGWLHLAAVLDLADRQVVGWAMAEHMRGELVEQALEMAIGRRRPPPGLLHHSDRGSQYASGDYRELLATHSLRASMSRKGNCWDNAVMERFFGTLKSEWCDPQRYPSPEDARRDIIVFIEMVYNSDRGHSTLGDLTPRERVQAVA